MVTGDRGQGRTGERTNPVVLAELARENAHLKSQLALLSRFSYQITSSLELNLVLQEVVEAACELTGASYGALAVLDGDRKFKQLLTHGLTEPQQRQLGEMPHGRGIIGMLQATNKPLRIADISSHKRFSGFPPGHPPMTTFLGANIQDGESILGSLYLTDKLQGEQFSDDDEKLLMLFCHQAVAPIRNARQFADERKARADAEAAKLAFQLSEIRLREETAELEGLRTNLLASIAHEFRTPLTAIRTSVGLLQDPGTPIDDSQEKRLLQAISESAIRMQRLVTDLVDLAKFRSGNARLQIRRFDAMALVKEATRTMTGLLHSKKLTVAMEGPGRVWVYGDRVRLGQALLNLLSNAVKHAPEGSTITIATAIRDGEATWAVTDHGPGIPLRAQRYLFERFFTVRQGDSARTGGIGLGLPIAMAIANAHGGSVDVRSSPGEGSTFTLRVKADSSSAIEDA